MDETITDFIFWMIQSVIKDDDCDGEELCEAFTKAALSLQAVEPTPSLSSLRNEEESLTFNEPKRIQFNHQFAYSW